ncbi:hypothetical protein CCP4SC76_790001 [Gammaproteobacteria bacterium]
MSIIAATPTPAQVEALSIVREDQGCPAQVSFVTKIER